METKENQKKQAKKKTKRIQTFKYVYLQLLDLNF